VRDRFVDHGVTPEQVRAVLEDGGDALYAAAGSGAEDWADRFGGPLAVALLAAEVSALAAHLNARGPAVRALAVDALLDQYSTVTVAAHLGVSRRRDQAWAFIPRRRQDRAALYPLPGAVAAMLVAGAAIGIWKLRS
jgi:hypothetical protein